MKIDIQYKEGGDYKHIIIEGVGGACINVWGIASPEGSVEAPFGTQFDQYDETRTTLLKRWFKATDSGNTGWE